MRPVVRLGSNLHVWLYRITGGRAQVSKYPTMLLSVPGRKTGKMRTTPVVYVMDGDCFVIAAAYAGSERNPTWWLNLKAAPEAEVQVLRRKLRVRAEFVPPEDREKLWLRLVEMYPYFLEYQVRTKRQIPLALLRPVKQAED